MAGQHDKDTRQDDSAALTEEEIAAQQGEQLPSREVMSVVSLTPDQPVVLGELEPPPNFPLNHSIETPPPID